MRIEMEDLGKTYGPGVCALDRVRLTLASPSMTGLVGPNGAGKTTLMQLLVGQMLPSTGSVRVDGWDLQRHGKTFRRKLGYLPQGFGLYEELTVRQFLDYMARLKGLGSSRRDALESCLERTALAEKADARIRTLSGGQKQRVGIAQALLNDPELLIVDEPTVGLDPEERIRFRNLFSRDAGRRLVILSTHIIEDVESVCNRLIVLHQGRIRFDGTPSELLRRAQGRVGVIEIKGEGESALDGRFRITGRVVTPQGASCRIVGRDLPPNCRPVAPTLEDAYIYCMSDGGNS
jgi:ABC-type multidrug transport system ATPase subunit